MKALIVGYGNAGKRHGHLLDDLGIEWSALDPYSEVPLPHYTCEDLTTPPNCDFVVIASPPDTHPTYIRRCLIQNVPVLCEKPLCGWDQLDEVKDYADTRLMMAFNFRFHPDWIDTKFLLDTSNYYSKANWTCISEENSIVSEWGLVLDRLPHTFDQLIWLSGYKPKIKYVCRITGNGRQAVQVEGELGRGKFSIWKAMNSEIQPEARGILTPVGFVRPDTSLNWDMFLGMYDYFLTSLKEEKQFEPNMKDGILVQECLEDVRHCIGE